MKIIVSVGGWFKQFDMPTHVIQSGYAEIEISRPLAYMIHEDRKIMEDGVIKTPIDNTFPLVASFVDENGNLQTDPTKPGVLKLQSGRDNYGVAISEQNSQITGTYEDGTLKKRTRGFSHFFGLNDVFETSSVKKNSALEFKLQDRIKKSPGLFPTSVLTRSIQSNVPNALPVWTYDVGEGNTDNAKAFSALKFIAFAFAQSGSAAQYNSTLGQYSADIISRFSTTSNNYIDANASEDTLLKSIDERRSSIESVNIDDELAKLLLYQNLYSAASRGISIVNSMFGELINILK
jgi:flagellar hook-associated protein FlgK